MVRISFDINSRDRMRQSAHWKKEVGIYIYIYMLLTRVSRVRTRPHQKCEFSLPVFSHSRSSTHASSAFFLRWTGRPASSSSFDTAGLWPRFFFDCVVATQVVGIVLYSVLFVIRDQECVITNTTILFFCASL